MLLSFYQWLQAFVCRNLLPMGKFLSLFDITLLFRSLWQHRSLMHQLVVRNISQRYKGAFLGFFWNFIQPLMMLCVYTFVFSFVFKARGWGGVNTYPIGAYPVIMFCGIATYNLFSDGINSSCNLIVSNPNFVKKVIFPLEILVAGQVLAVFLTGILWFLLVLAGVLLVFKTVHWTILFFPLMLPPLFFITLGVAYFVSSLQVFLKDTRYVVTVVLQMLFYMTPIFYAQEMLPARFRIVFQLNPLARIVNGIRAVFIFGETPQWFPLAVTYLISLAVLQLGFFWFKRTKRGFADVL